MRLTERQEEVLSSLAHGPRTTWGDGAVLRALEKKGLAAKHYNAAPGYTYFTWTATEFGEEEHRRLLEAAD